MVFSIYLSALTSSLMFTFYLLFVLISCLSSLDLSIKLNPKKYRQSDSALERFRVTKCGWLRLCTAVAIGTNLTNFLKLFHHGVKRNHYEFLIGIIEFTE